MRHIGNIRSAGHTVGRIHANRGGEFSSSSLQQWCSQQVPPIIIERSPAVPSSSAGLVERLDPTLETRLTAECSTTAGFSTVHHMPHSTTASPTRAVSGTRLSCRTSASLAPPASTIHHSQAEHFSRPLTGRMPAIFLGYKPDVRGNTVVYSVLDKAAARVSTLWTCWSTKTLSSGRGFGRYPSDGVAAVGWWWLPRERALISLSISHTPCHAIACSCAACAGAGTCAACAHDAAAREEPALHKQHQLPRGRKSLTVPLRTALTALAQVCQPA